MRLPPDKNLPAGPKHAAFRMAVPGRVCQAGPSVALAQRTWFIIALCRRAALVHPGHQDGSWSLRGGWLMRQTLRIGGLAGLAALMLGCSSKDVDQLGRVAHAVAVRFDNLTGGAQE